MDQNVRELANAKLVGPRMDGQRPAFVGTEYLGAPNPVVRFFGSGNNYQNEFQKSKSYKLKFTNTGSAATDKIIAISPGGEASAANITVPGGVTVDAIVGDGTIISTLNEEVTCIGSPEKVARFLRYIDRNPLRISGMQLRSSSAEQLQEPFTVVKHNITRTPAAETIDPGNFIKSADSNDKLVEFGINHLQADDQTTIYFKLLAGVTLTISMYLGATVNPAALLAVDAAKAYETFSINNEQK